MRKTIQNQKGSTPAPIFDWFRGKSKIKKSHFNGSNRNFLQLARGYTLIEVVISLFIISVVILVYAVASHSVVLNRDAKYRQLANRISVSLMEDLRDTPFNSMPVSGPLNHPLLANLPEGSCALDISDVNDDLKQASIIVTWREPGSQATHEARLVTYIGEHGM